MKATIVKNDSFETVGFEVVASGKTMFSWGVAPVASLYFIKEANTKEWETDIMALLQLDAERKTLNRMSSMFFSILTTNKDVKHLLETKDCGFNMTELKQQIDEKETAIKNIIANIK